MTRSAASRVPPSSDALQLDRLDAARRPRRPAGACAGWRRSGGRARRVGVEEQHRDPVPGGAERGDVVEARRRGGGRRRAPAGRSRCPGAPASSTIFSTSDVGRLSTTYQPRSSSTSAAAGPPRPGHPRDQHDVRHGAEASQRRVLGGSRRYEQRGDVAASAYSGARARNPGGGAGSTIRSTAGRWRPAR